MKGKTNVLLKRTGAMLLCVSLMFSMLLSVGLSEYSYAETAEEKAALTAEEAEAPAAVDAEAPAEEKAEAPAAEEAEAPAAEEAEASEDKDAGLKAAEESKLEFVGFSREKPLYLGTFRAGYTKKEAEDSREYITVKNSGDTTLSIDPADLNVTDKTSFYFMGTGIPSELEPGETRVIGWVQPRHQMNPGTYASRVSFCDSGSTYAYGTVGYYVVSRSCEIDVLDDDEDEIDSLELQSVLKGDVRLRSEKLWLINYSSDAVSYEISSSNKLFDVEFYYDSEADSLEMTGIVVSLNKRRAENLDVGTYTGNIIIKATLKGSSQSTEVKLPVSISITEKPCWENKEYSATVPEWYAEYFSQYINILNTDAFGSDTNKYLRAEIAEGSEYFKFDSSIYYDGDIRLCSTGKLAPGTYAAVMKLYYDSNGSGGEGVLCDTSTFTLIVKDDESYENDYKLEVVNEGIQYDTLDLGMLKEGYRASDAEALSVQIKLKNTGNKDLKISPAGFKPEYASEAENFVISSTSDESVTLKPGDIYDAVSVRPKENMEPGSYTMEMEITDDDGMTYYDLEVMYFVAVEGMHLRLQRSSLFSPTEIIGPEGVDFGTLAPDQEASTIYRYIDFDNIGSVPFKATVSLENDDNEAFVISPVWEDGKNLSPGYYTSITVKCDPSKVQELGTYEARLKVTCAAESGDPEVRYVPLKLTRANKEVCNVVLDFQNKGGYVNKTAEVVKGSTYKDVVTQMMSEVMNVKYGTIPWPTDDEYTMIAITKKKDSELHSWDEAEAGTEEIRTGTVEEDTTIYINWARKIDRADLKVKVPECGDPASGKPEITPEEGVKFSIANEKWDVSEGETTLEGDTEYTMSAVLLPEFGWAFPNDADLMINGKRAARDSESKNTSALTISGTLTAVHESGDWIPAGEKEHVTTCSKCHRKVYEEHNWDNGDETTSPTCYDPGEITYTCTDCGYKMYETVPVLEHEYKFTVTKNTSGTEMGHMDCECLNCGDVFEDQFKYDCTEGAGFAYYRGSRNLPFFAFERFNLWGDDVRPDACFTGIRIDDKEYPYNDENRQYYRAVTYYKTQTEIRFLESFAKSLADGKHTLTLLYKDGESETVKFTVADPNMISEVDLTIGAPVCGDSASRSYDLRTGEVIENPPVVTLSGDAPYEITSTTYWTDSSTYGYWSGTFKGGETAYAYVCLAPKEGSLFCTNDDFYDSFNGTVKVNGQEVTPAETRSYSNYMRFWVPVEAVHAWDEGTVTKEPTADAEGVMTFTCKKCGETKEVSVSNEKEKEEARKAAALADGAEHKVSEGTVRIVSSKDKTVSFFAANEKSSSATIPATVEIEGVKFDVTSISPNAFKGTNVKTITVRTTGLTKAGVKDSLKGSKVKTVKVKVGSKKVNKTYVKKYKKFFTKKNAGRKVKVK